MSDQPGTLDAILAEFRAFALRAADEDKMISPESVLLLADKVETAAERERNAHTNDIHDALYKATGIPGNAAELCEALKRIVGCCEGCHADVCEKVCRPELTSESIHAALAALATPARNCERFNSWEDAYIAWVKETQDCADHPIDWGELPGDTYEAAQELWMNYFADDQNREFCDWLWELEETK